MILTGLRVIEEPPEEPIHSRFLNRWREDSPATTTLSLSILLPELGLNHRLRVGKFHQPRLSP